MENFYGKYRGLVMNNIDPNRMGRLQVSCPRVLGENMLAWAMPCVPFAGINEGFFMMPMMGSNVWVEFEGGDPNYAIWSGCYWTQQTVPSHTATPFVRTIATTTSTITLDDTPGAGGVTVALGPAGTPPVASVKLGVTGVEITFGAHKIAMRVDAVDVNSGALRVM